MDFLAVLPLLVRVSFLCVRGCLRRLGPLLLELLKANNKLVITALQLTALAGLSCVTRANLRSWCSLRLELLRKLVPHAERANTACFLEEVIKYIESLKARTMELESLLEAATGKPAPKPSRPGLSAAASLLPSRNPSEAHGQLQGDGDQSPGLSAHGLAAAPAPAQQPTQSAPSAPAPAPSSPHPHGHQPLGTSAGSVSLSLSKQGQGASSGLHGSQHHQQQQLVASLQQQQQQGSGNNGSNGLPLSLLQLQQASGQQQLRELQLGQSSTMQQHAAMLQQVQAQAQQGSLSLSGLGHHGTQLSLSGLGGGALTLPSGGSLTLAQLMQQQQQQHPQHHQSSQHQQVSQHLDLQSLQVMQQALQQQHQQQGRAALASANGNGATNSSGAGSVFQPSNNKAFLTFNEDLYNMKPDILTANAARSLQGLASATPSTSLQLTTTQLPADSNANTVGGGGDTSRRGMPGSPNTSEESGVPLKKRKVLMLT